MKNREPLILKGSDAFSPFRVRALIGRIAQVAPGLKVRGISAVHAYFIETAGRVSGDILEKSRALLGAGEAMKGAGRGFFVIPRPGTISPWSSKATDIFHNCGLAGISRVERGIHYVLSGARGVVPLECARPVLDLVRDRMTEAACTGVSGMFRHMQPRPSVTVDILSGGREALARANTEMGLALSADEVDYLFEHFKAWKRNPTDAELVMFGQVNSEHCRHKIFRADWIVDGEKKDISLFDMIRNTHARHPAGTLVAYRDNAAVIEGFREGWFEAGRGGPGVYGYDETDTDIVMKVETHNHPTAICPYPGAATGIGGEIRDEAATGVGARTKAGLSGFMVSNLRIPGFVMPWERDYAEFPRRLATPLQIMLEGPIGGARFGNEFGRPQLCGFFRTYEERFNGRYRGYHKPIMIAGGMGTIKRIHAAKKDIPTGARIIQIGGPAMRIGLGGGAASSMDTGSNEEHLDYDSVQRDNAEMQRRCQGVIEACVAMNRKNPICSIHDLGAGGLSNGCPELVSETGGRFWLRKVHNEELSMSPMEIWCCEAQERYVLAVLPGRVDDFLRLCERERCPAAVIGEATRDNKFVLYDAHFRNKPIDMDVHVLLGKPPVTLRNVKRLDEPRAAAAFHGVTPPEAARRVLRLPAVADKTFLITIADRTVMGMTARDQMVGPYQVPISDLAVNTISYKSVTGSAMAIGERTGIALVSGPASARMAIGEALTNICGAHIGGMGAVKLSANWMCACGEPGEDARLFETVRAAGMEFCPAIGVSIPVGKDSLSMRTVWRTSDGRNEKMVAPLSLVVSSFAPVRDVRRTVTADIKGETRSSLVLIDLGEGRNRLGCSALARVYNQVGSDCPDVDRPELLVSFWNAVQELVAKGLLLAYHDRSDGGLFVTLAEMAFGGRHGLAIDLAGTGGDPLAVLFNEELGAVIQVGNGKLRETRRILARHGLAEVSRVIGKPAAGGRLTIAHGGPGQKRRVLSEKVTDLRRAWSELTFRMQKLRDNPGCAKQEYDNLLDGKDPGLSFRLTYDPAKKPAKRTARPRVAILREQGVNGHIEMAAAFDAAGFKSVDVHMTDLHGGLVTLDDFAGLVACGGFSYGDVLGAGAGWAKSILFNADLKHMFQRFFGRPDTFALGVCNGCQMLSQLKDIIPGAGHWPEFARNKCEQFEARYVTVEVLPSPSVLLRGMAGSRIPIPVAHGEGRADFGRTGSRAGVQRLGLPALRYVDNRGRATERYPYNPNGSPGGLAGLSSEDGRVTIMMPHPERAFRSVQLSYWPFGTSRDEGPWLRMFRNAREFAG